MVEEWGLQPWAGPILARWNEINLYTMTRGVNRFKGLAMALTEIDARYTPIEGLAEFRAWADTAPELSNDGPGRLEIFAVNGDAETNLQSGTIVEPGDSFKVKARSDKPSFRLELFTNDPVRPYKELIFKY